jgi:hypothetical protein
LVIPKDVEGHVMSRARSFLGVCIVVLSLSALFLPGRAFGQSETGMGPTAIYSQFVTGDFVVGSNNTRQAVIAPATLPQTNSYGITLSGIPVGATVIQAYANWSYQTNFTPNNGEANIIIDGTPYTGTLTGTATPDLNWAHAGTDAYTADVTSIVAPNGNGSYTITGGTDSATTDALGEGISIVAVWSKAGSPVKNVDIYSGLTTDASGPALATFGFDAPYQGGQAIYTDFGSINGIPMTTVHLTGIGPETGNTWNGLVGRNATDNEYDQATGDVSSYMNIGDTSLTVHTLGGGNSGGDFQDHIGHSFGAISFAAVPEPSAVALVFIGASLLLLRRRTRRLA